MMVAALMSLAARVKWLRENHDPSYSQAELARLVGVDKSYIGSIEAGRVKLPSTDVLRGLARELETTNADLLNAAGYLPQSELEALADSVEDPRFRLWLRRASGVKEEGHKRVIAGVIREIVEMEEAEAPE